MEGVKKMENEKVKNNSSIDSIKEQDPIDLLKVDPTFSRLMHEYYKKQGIESDPELKARCLEFFDEHKKKLIAEGKIKNNWTNRIKDLDISWVVRITVPVAATIFIIGISVAIFYYFIGKKNTLPIANNPTPIVTSTPISNNPTPTPILSASPIIVENNKTNENNKLNGNPEKNNSVNVAKVSNNTNKINKPINIKKDSSNKDNVKIPNAGEKETIDKEEIANTNNQKDISIGEASSERGITVKKLEDLLDLPKEKNIIYIDASINPELRNELAKALEATYKFTVVMDSTKPHNIIFRWLLSKPNTIALGSDFNPIIWSKFVGENTPEEQAKNIVSSLLEVLQSVKKQQ